MEAAERALLAETVHDALGRAPDNADDVLAELGWFEMLATETDAALDVVFTTLGRTNASATVLDDVVVHALGVEPRADLSVLLPSFGRWDAPTTDGLATGRLTRAAELLLPNATTVPVGVGRATRVHGVDPAVRLHVVQIESSDAPADPARWDDAVALARRAIAHQTAGACRAMLDLARAHAVERVQFGRPIARFQAVRHRLAEALVAIEALDATLQAAGDEPGPRTAALAKVVAGRTARTVAAQCQQVLAGIGFTTDHAFHLFLKRTMVLDGLFGSADEVALDVGRWLLATRTVPTLIEL
jgi:hypothetical protein